MAWSIKIERRAELDLERAYDHFFATAISAGDSDVEAAQIARRRMIKTLAALERLSVNPYRGTTHDNLAVGLRHVTIDRAVFWFRPDEQMQIIWVVGISHGGQDHFNRMMVRLTSEGGAD